MTCTKIFNKKVGDHMEQNITLRMATIEDAEQILAIYAPYCTETVITFEYEVPTLEEFQGRMKNIMEKYPYIVAEHDGKIVGYAYASAYRTRAAYQWDVESSIYVDMNCRASGVGSALYARLLDLLKKQNIRNVYACVTLPNEASERIHAKFGFDYAGMLHKAGFKAGEWQNVGWFEKHFEYESEVPEPVKWIHEIQE